MLIIDDLAYASRFRTIHPGKKMAATGLLLLLAVILQSMVLGVALTGIMGACSIWGGGTPGRIYVRLLKLPLLFIGLSLLAIVAQVTAAPEAGAVLCLGPAGGLYLTVSAEGLYRGVRLSCSALGAVSCMYFLALSTPLTDIIYVMEKLRCPCLIIELMLLIYRFVFLLWQIAGELQKAADSRMGTVNLRTSIRTSGQMFATLFIRALKRSSAIYDAMESRGYDGTIRVLPGFRAEKKEAEGEIHE